MLALGEVVLAGGFVADQRDDDLATVRGELLADEHEVAVENAGFDHGIIWETGISVCIYLYFL